MGIFEPFRAIGYITNNVPFSVQRLGTETFVTVSVGKAWQIYNVIVTPYRHSCSNSGFLENVLGKKACVFLRV